MENNNEKKFAVPIAVVVLIIIAGFGTYFLINKEEVPKTLAEQEQKLRQQIAEAKKNVTKEKDKLNGFEKAFRSAFPFYGIADEEYENVSEAIGRTDFLFDNPNSANPKIKLEILATLEKSINDKRSQVSLALIAWKEKADSAISKNLDNKTLQAIIAEAAVVKSYVDELNLIVDNLTTENSGLSQETIDYYEDVLDGVNSVIESTVTALANAESAPSASADTNADTSAQATAQATIATQQEAVAQAEAELQALEEQLADILEQIEAIQQAADDISTGYTNVVETSGTDVTAWPDLIIQPGEPRLVEGANHY